MAFILKTSDVVIGLRFVRLLVASIRSTFDRWSISPFIKLLCPRASPDADQGCAAALTGFVESLLSLTWAHRPRARTFCIGRMRFDHTQNEYFRGCKDRVGAVTYHLRRHDGSAALLRTSSLRSVLSRARPNKYLERNWGSNRPISLFSEQL